MKLFFCGTMVPEEMEYRAEGISAAGNRFQNNLIKNLSQSGHEVQTLSYVAVPLAPETVQFLQEQDGLALSGQASPVGESAYGEWENNQGNSSCRYVVKNGNLFRSIRVFIKAAKGFLIDADIVICYNIIYAWLFLPIWAKKRQKKSIVVLADYSGPESYGSIFGKIYARLQLWSMRRFDVVVGLSANMERKLRKNQQFVLMEGGIDRELYDSFSYKPHKEGEPVTFMYSGLLNRVTGVDILLEAMKRIKRQDIRLQISGKGELKEAVIAAWKEDERIRFLGHLPYEEYVRRLQEADVLVNPRNMDLPENQNNFPSKIMDYLASGKPVISTRFAGWEKFEDNIVFCDSSAEDLWKHMERAGEALNDANTEAIYRKNRQKAEQYKWEKQAERILSNVGKLDV